MTTKPPLSLRVPEATRVRVEKWATEEGLPRNAAYVQLIERGLKAAGPHPGLNERPVAKPLVRGKLDTVTESVVFGPVDALTGEPLKPRGPMQKGAGKKR